MKNLLFLPLLYCFFTFHIYGQSPVELANAVNLSLQNPNHFRAEFGLLLIDGESYIGTRLQPELSLGKIGFGLNVPVFYSLSKSRFRTEEYQDGVGLLRLIDYFRYGQKKKDNFFIRLVRLDAAYLGYGILMNNYSNTISFEKRVVGMEFDFIIDERFGLEGMYNNLDFSSFHLLAIRPYYRPFGKTLLPIINTMEIGVGFVGDFDQAESLFTSPIDASPIKDNSHLRNGMIGLSLDMGVFLLNTDFVDISTYAQYGRLFKNQSAWDAISKYPFEDIGTDINYADGQGASVGISSRMRFILNIFEVTARIERQWNSRNFLPHFFDYAYEINKDAKIERLALAEESRGIFGTLVFDVVDKIFISGGLLMPDKFDEKNPATAFINLYAPDFIPKTFINGRIIKSNIKTFKEIPSFDEYTQANLIAAYKIFPFFHVGVDYRWTFVPNSAEGLKINHQVMPYVSLNIPINEW